MTFCEEWSLVKTTPDRIEVTPLRCRSWGCHECGPRRKQALIAKAFAGKPDSFLTLTCNTNEFRTPDEGARELANTWRLLRKRAMRHYGYKRLPFLAVFEATENGWPHLHIVMRCPWLDQKWISRQMEDLMKSPICWIERIANDGRIAYYISKYVGKESHRFGTCKRYWCSQDWERLDERDQEEDDDVLEAFEIVQITQGTYVQTMQDRGWWATWERDRCVLTWYERPGATAPPPTLVRPQRNSWGWYYDEL